MTDFATLVLTADTRGLARGEGALDSLAKTGGRAEGKLTVDMGKIEAAMDRLGASMGSLEGAMARSMARVGSAGAIGARTFEDLRRAIDPAVAANARYAEVVREAAAFVQSGAATQAQANEVLEVARSRYLGVATAAEQAEEAQRQSAQAVALATGNYNALRMSLDPIYAASKRYEDAQKTLAAAVAAGAVSQAQATRVLAMAETQFLGAGRAAGQSVVGINQANSATGKFGMVANQLGYQIQDVFASGPMIGWFRAIAQQAPQAAGAFAMLGGRLGALIPMFGTAIAIGAAFIPMLLNSAAATKTLSERLDDLTSNVGAWREAIANAKKPASELAAEFGMGADQARRLYEAMSLISQAQFAKALSEAQMSISESIGDMAQSVALYDKISQLETYGDANQALMNLEAMGIHVAALNEDFGVTLEQARAISQALGDVRMSKGPQEAADAAQRLANEIMNAQKAGAGLPPHMIESAMNAAKLAEQSLYAAHMLQTAENEAAGIAPQINSASAALDALTGRVQFLAGVFGPAIGAANQLAQALANAASQLGGVTSGIANFTAAGQGVSAVTGFFGALANPVETAKKALAGAGKALQTYHAGAVNAAQAGAKLDLTLGKIGGGGGKKRGGSAGAAADALDEAAKAAAELREEMERPFITAIDGVADAWGDFLSRGGQDFKGFASDIKDTFQRLISGMIADAARNRIMIWLDIGQGGAVPGSDGVPSAGGLASLGGIFGKDGWLGSRLSSGKGFLGSIGSLLGYGGTAGAGGGALAGLTGFLGTAGALLGGIGALIGIGKALFGRSLKDVGVQGSFTGDNFSGETYKFYKGGLFRSDKTSTEALDAATSAVIGSAYADLRGNIRDMASVLGLGSDAIRDFAHDFKISTKDMTEEQIVQALQEEMGKAGAGMAEIVLGTDRFTRAGESALDTMARLSSSLSGMRDVADLLGHRFAWAGLRGADLASGVVDAFGGLDQMGSAVLAYWQTFYGENARLRTVTRQTRETLADLGAAMPRTRDEYRRMIEAIDLSDRSSHELYATLIGLSGVMDQILPAASGLTRQLERMQDRLSLQLGRVSEGLTEAIRINRAAADDWFKAGGTIRDYLDKLRGSASALVSRQAALAYNRVQYLSTLRDARGGNVEAAQGLSGRAQDYLASVMGSASTAFEAARAQARVMAQIGGVATTSDRYGNALDRAATLQERQLTAIERLQEFIANGGTVTAERLAAVRDRIATLDGSISVVSRRNADLTIAGFNDALTSTPVQIEGGMALREAMGGLRGSLRELRQAVVAETERQERESRIAALDRFVSGLTLNGQGKAFVGDADLSRMAEIVGLNTAGLSTAQIRTRLAGYSSTDKLTGTVYDPTGSREAGYLDRKNADPEGPDTITDPLMGFRLGFGWRGSTSGEWHQIVHGPLGGARSFVVDDDVDRRAWLESLVKSGKLPAFEAGGYHSGGLRMVGERGTELEVTGPARYYNARQTQQMLHGGSPEMLAELRALRAEMAALRSEHRQLALKTEQNTFETARFARAADRRAQAAES